MPDREGTCKQAKRNKSNHAPEKCRRVGNAQECGAEFQSEESKDHKTDSAAEEIDGGHTPQRIVERAGSRDDHRERKWRWGEARHSDRKAGPRADFLMKPLKLFVSRHLSDSFFSKFARDQRQNQDPNG